MTESLAAVVTESAKILILADDVKRARTMRTALNPEGSASHLTTPSAPFTATSHWQPFLVRMVFTRRRLMGLSSTMSTRFPAKGPVPAPAPLPLVRYGACPPGVVGLEPLEALPTGLCAS